MTIFESNLEKMEELRHRSTETKIRPSQKFPLKTIAMKDSVEQYNVVYSLINASTTLISPVVSSDWDEIEITKEVRDGNVLNISPSDPII